MSELVRREKRCILFDLMADPKFEDWGVIVDNCKDLVKLATKTERFNIRVQFDEVERFDFICSLTLRKPHGLEVLPDTCIAVDEISSFCSPYYMPKYFGGLIRLGRHSNARFIGTTQRPPDINPLILSQAKEWYLFQMHLPRDVEYLKKFVPEIDKVRTLKIGEYILWTPEAKTLE